MIETIRISSCSVEHVQLAKAFAGIEVSMKRRIATALCSLAVSAFALLLFVVPAQAKEVTVQTIPYKDSYLDVTISYDDEFKYGETKTFTVNVANNKDTMQYRVYSFNLDGGGDLIDVSPGKNPYKTDNHFSYAFHSPGTYCLSFNVADGVSGLSEFLRYTIYFTIPPTGQFRPVEDYVKEITDLCNTECAAKGDTSQYAKALWLNDWIINHTIYDLDGMTAATLFATGRGRCEAYHEAYCLLLNKVGIETRRVDSIDDNHVWTGAKLDGQWYNIDTTGNDAEQTSSSYPDVQHLYFGLPSNIILLKHTKWDGKYSVSYPQRADFNAQSYDCNYFIRSGEISKYTSAYLASTGERSVKAHLDAGETSFSIPIENTNWPPNYKNVIYSLVAYQLSQTDWGSEVKLSVSYSNEVLGEETLEFQAAYGVSNIPMSIADATFTGPNAVDYTGQSLTPEFTVLVDGNTLVEGKDYEVSFTNNVNAGTATVEITGKGSYTGKATKTFKINSFAIANTSIGSVGNQQYTGKPLTPAIQVSHNGKQLVKDTDYSILYENNINAGTAKIILTGKGNYTGSATVSFNIIKNENNSSSSSSSAKPSNPGTSTTPSTPAKISGTWIKSGARWWYKYDGATQKATGKQYPYNEFVTINGVDYHFDGAGWMHTGWQYIGGKWYFFNGSGAKTTGWQYVGGRWYHLGTDGKMLTGWKIDGAKYYLSGSGAMVTGWQYIGKIWYLFNGSGAATTGWQRSGGKWYWMDKEGKMRTGWLETGGATYYLSGSGAMVTGWLKLGSVWYYFNGSGAKVTNRWIGNYWLGANGVMVTNSWVDNNKYYVGANGAWVPGKRR